ncbi:hypothetical protein KY289_001455 [Solanum tuberosum]|nr:hypothetical protein KY289_001455 [Solanum tuberosum]
MASKKNEGVNSSVVLTPFFYGTDFEYWKIRMRTHLKAECLWTIVVNGYEEPKNDGELSVTEMKNLEAKYRQDTKALRKIQMGVSRAYFAKIATCETAKEAWESLEMEVYGDEKLLKKKDMVQGLPEIHTDIKVENTSIISLDVSNQEEDEKEEDIPQGGEILDSDDEEPPPRRKKC